MNYTTIGKNEVKVDAKAKATGEARYVGDMYARGMLIGKVLRSPYAHAKILNIDTSKAERLSGVKAVLTYKDTPKVPFNFAAFPPSEAAILIEDQYIFSDKARFVGDPIAGVAAVDEETAQEALELIEVEYEPLPTILSAEEAFKNKELLIHEHDGPKEHIDGNICGKIPAVIGDMEEGFDEADYIFEGTYKTQKAFQASMEPCSAALAEPDINGRIKITTSTQMPHLVRKITARSLDMPIRDVQIVKPYVGGGFGSRLGLVNEPIAGLLAKKTGQPVRVTYDREESFYTESRHPATMTLKTGIKKDGTFTARYMKALVDTGAYVTHGPSLTAVLGGWFVGMYKSPNIQLDGYTVHTNTPPAGAFRGYGNPQVAFAVESQVDEIAEELGLDPIEIRLKNHPCEGETWLWSKMPIESCGLEECIEKATKRIGWEEKKNKEKKEEGTKRRGVGFGYMMHVSGAKPELHENSSAIIKVNEDGSVNLTYACSDIGTGSATALSQICAETLGVKFEDVVITQDADTDTAPFEIGSHASRQIYSGGYAVEQAAKDAKDGLLEMASKMMDCSPEELETGDGHVYLKEDPERSLSIEEVSFEAHFGEHGHQIMGIASTEPPGNPPVYAVQFTEVEVDVETGKVDVLDFVAAHDTGVAIHPPSVEGQIEGAIQQGMGYALTEDMQYSDDGHPMNANFSDYKVLTSVDMPDMDPIVVEAASETGAFGAKSVGESGLVATAPAIANAIYDAVGVRIKELPITPEKLLAAIKEKNNTEGEVAAATEQVASTEE
ncbi:xanthine dehydrogenase family protein molybdopterin-binding subunit [Selenihalanaerobacter shriftii]|uniref:Xanthine dehydrogenase molybdenum-binding subunit n=1 Tax=Selenihalanaerobacter shriftii TaxID=142842 RepID=A0A1T4JK53_9FIRM|nr:molybdopterin cofactor-binding domain-containing protein [Selenihalanaerobacter shriftii]SJZ30508.1 xanthine dehydrogenase molybdenum-binding subunit [Selenihalanaerobacter shriftii]